MFQGFSPDTFSFLNNLKENNNKTWFETNREIYRNHILGPLQDLITELTPFMLTIDPLFTVNPKKAVSRINRDIRFSKDKSPYRANMWLVFKRLYIDWKVEPAFFFEIYPDYYRYGMGFYNVPRETMDKLRAMINGQNKNFQKIHSLYQEQKTFKIEGEKYKKILNLSLSEDLNEWYQRKDLYFVCNKELDNQLYGASLVDMLIEDFKLLVPFYNFLVGLRKSVP